MNNTSITGLSAKQLRRAASIQERIEELQNELARLLGGNASTAPAASAEPVKKRKKRRMSAAGRAAIAAAARARWARERAEKKK